MLLLHNLKLNVVFYEAFILKNNVLMQNDQGFKKYKLKKKKKIKENVSIKYFQKKKASFV